MSNFSINGDLKCKNRISDDSTTLTSPLNVSDITVLNHTVSLLSSLNISVFTTLNNNVTIVLSFNVSGLTTLSKIPPYYQH